MAMTRCTGTHFRRQCVLAVGHDGLCRFAGRPPAPFEDRPMIHFHLPKALLRAVGHYAVDAELDRARAIQALLEQELARRAPNVH